jgi:hypothetical protein
VLLVVAGLLFSLFWFITVGVGLSEPGHLTGLQSLLVVLWALLGPLLILTGIVSVRCETRKRLWLVGALAAAAAATVALCLILQASAA